MSQFVLQPLGPYSLRASAAFLEGFAPAASAGGEVEYLHQLAQATLEGKLEATFLRGLSPEQALERLKACLASVTFPLSSFSCVEQESRMLCPHTNRDWLAPSPWPTVWIISRQPRRPVRSPKPGVPIAPGEACCCG